MIRVELPFHLRTLARVEAEVQLEVEGPATLRSVLDALEARYPMLRGTIRDHATHRRRPFLRFRCRWCENSFSHPVRGDPFPHALARDTNPAGVRAR